ncbi:MAG: tetratricopeptide repeat protein [Polyangiales bacterium]
MFSVIEGPSRPFRWTFPNGDVGMVEVRPNLDLGIVALWFVDASGTEHMMREFPYDQYGPPYVIDVNLRENGRLVVRAGPDPRDDPAGQTSVGHWDLIDGVPSEIERWDGSVADYRGGLAPSWTKLTREADEHVTLDAAPVPATACSSYLDCNDRADRLRASGSLRFALDFYLAALSHSPEAPSAIFDAAQVYVAADEPERAIEMLQRLGSIDTDDARRTVQRIPRERAFRELRQDPRIAELLRTD